MLEKLSSIFNKKAEATEGAAASTGSGTPPPTPESSSEHTPEGVTQNPTRSLGVPLRPSAPVALRPPQKIPLSQVSPGAPNTTTSFTRVKKRITQRIAPPVNVPGETASEAPAEAPFPISVAPAPVEVPVAQSDAAAPAPEVNYVAIPMEFALSALPSTALIDSKDALLGRPEAAYGVSIPLSHIFSLLPSGKIEFFVKDFVRYFSPGFVKDPDALGDDAQVVCQLPLQTVVLSIPPELLNPRVDQKPVDRKIIEMAAPFNFTANAPASAPVTPFASSPDVTPPEPATLSPNPVQASAPAPEPVPEIVAAPEPAPIAATPEPEAPVISPEPVAEASALEPATPAVIADTVAEPVTSFPEPAKTEEEEEQNEAHAALARLAAAAAEEESKQQPDESSEAKEATEKPVEAEPEQPTPSTPEKMSETDTIKVVDLEPSTPAVLGVEAFTPPPPPPTADFAKELARLSEQEKEQTSIPEIIPSELPPFPIRPEEATTFVKLRPVTPVTPLPPLPSAEVPQKETFDKPSTSFFSEPPPPVPTPEPVEKAPAEPSRPDVTPEPTVTTFSVPSSVPVSVSVSVSTSPAPTAPEPAPVPVPLPASSSSSKSLDLNSCTLDELKAVCPDLHLARKVLAWRELHGPFSEPSALWRVPGMTVETYRALAGIPSEEEIVSRELQEAFGQGESEPMTIKSLVSRIRDWPFMIGCVIAGMEGLPIAYDCEDEAFAKTVSAFLPRLLARTNSTLSEVNESETEEIFICKEDRSLFLFRSQHILLLAINRRKDLPMRDADLLRQVVAHLARMREPRVHI